MVYRWNVGFFCCGTTSLLRCQKQAPEAPEAHLRAARKYSPLLRPGPSTLHTIFVNRVVLLDYFSDLCTTAIGLIGTQWLWFAEVVNSGCAGLRSLSYRTIAMHIPLSLRSGSRDYPTTSSLQYSSFCHCVVRMLIRLISFRTPFLYS